VGVTAGIASAVGGVASAAKGIAGGGGASGKSDTAGQMDAAYRQIATQLYNNLQVPELDKSQYGGYSWLKDFVPETYDPWVGQAYQMSDDQQSLDAQRQSLGQLQDFAKGGLQPADLVALQQIQQQQAGAGSSAAATAADALRARGLGGSGAEYAARIGANQQAANSSQQLYDSAMQQALTRQLNAVTGAGNLAGNIRQQSDNVSQQMANINNTFNSQVQQLRTNAAINSANVRNSANAANLAGRQNTANQNVDTANRNTDLTRQLQQQTFNNQLQKIAGQANSLTGQANLAGAQQAAYAQQAYGNNQSITNGLQAIAGGAKQIGQNTNIGSWLGSQADKLFGGGSPSIDSTNADIVYQPGQEGYIDTTSNWEV